MILCGCKLWAPLPERQTRKCVALTTSDDCSVAGYLLVAPVKNPPYQSHLALHQIQIPLYLVYLMLYLDHILHPLWQGEGAFLKLPQSTSASGYKHYKCYITMLQCLIWGRGAENAGEWKALTQGTKGKRT